MDNENNRSSFQADAGLKRSAEPIPSKPATQIDAGWRNAAQEAPAKPATQIDAGWRNAAQEAPAKPATQIDAGWRNAAQEAPAKPATQIDAGWRNAAQEAPAKPATQIDAGWRNAAQEAPAKTATQIDEGWRKAASTAPVSQPGEEWRNNVANLLGQENTGAAANYFSTIAEFKDTMERLTELRTYTGNTFAVKGTISKAGGEAIILLCADCFGNDVAAKIYYEPVNGAGSSISTRSRVLEYMGTAEGQRYTLAVSEIGLVEVGGSKYYFEIMPYCKNTDLSDDGALSFDRIVEITAQLNEAIHSIHMAGIIHRDIKPENLYEIDGQVKLGDFGIAKNGALGRSNVTGHILGTEGYAAPETRRYVFNEKSDYYSMGVTLATLFEGHFVFENMTYEMQVAAQESESLPLMRVDPRRSELENLFNGLCRIDSKRRFGYDDVKRWLADHNYTGGATSEEWPRPYILVKGEDGYRDERSLFEGITQDEKHWEAAKTHLYNKYIEPFFASFRPDLAREAQVADEEYRTDNRDKGLAVFLKSLYAPGPIVWKGYTFRSLGELGAKMAATKNPVAYSEILQNQCISHWLENTEGISVDADTIKLVRTIEALSLKEPEVACYWFGNSFAPERSLIICGHNVKTVQELIDVMFADPGSFYNKDAYKKLLSRSQGAALYGFLYSFGYKPLIDEQWKHLSQCDLFNKTVLLFSMLDHIAVKENANPNILRRFFITYGPVGTAVYTRSLLVNPDNRPYRAMDAEGKKIIAEISDFKLSSSGSIDELFKAYLPLIESVDKFHRNLTENPHCIMTGVYDSRGIICTNLIGCFAYKIFDKYVPLGFNAFLESADGGRK